MGNISKHYNGVAMSPHGQNHSIVFIFQEQWL